MLFWPYAPLYLMTPTMRSVSSTLFLWLDYLQLFHTPCFCGCIDTRRNNAGICFAQESLCMRRAKEMKYDHSSADALFVAGNVCHLSVRPRNSFSGVGPNQLLLLCYEHLGVTLSFA